LATGGLFSKLKFAVHDLLPVIVTDPSTQSESPNHPENLDPTAATGVRVTTCPLLKLATHVPPQLIPEGLEVTVPLPLPVLVNVRLNCWVVLNVAVQLLLAFIVTEPSLQSELPLQPAKVEPLAGLAVSVTTCPLVKLALHVAPQLIPEGLEVTVPLPVPTLVAVKV
jgi:hypothetical protein